MEICINKGTRTLRCDLLFVYVTRLAICCSQICKLFGFYTGEGIKDITSIFFLFFCFVYFSVNAFASVWCNIPCVVGVSNVDCFRSFQKPVA